MSRVWVFDTEEGTVAQVSWQVRGRAEGQALSVRHAEAEQAVLQPEWNCAESTRATRSLIQLNDVFKARIQQNGRIWLCRIVR